MKACIQKGTDGECTSVNWFVALEGFRLMGWEIVPFVDDADLVGNEADEVVVADIGQVRQALRGLGKEVPAEPGYPAALQPFLGRRMWQSTINAVASRLEQWPVFVKPIHSAKKFTGVLVRGT